MFLNFFFYCFLYWKFYRKHFIQKSNYNKQKGSTFYYVFTAMVVIRVVDKRKYWCDFHKLKLSVRYTSALNVTAKFLIFIIYERKTHSE